ncbi:MAG: hypothetical protein GF346_00785, partial [Candidatus Eisenbacteria bacterium]|nr:hypothetical protein [Candidatus Latescibacterota bacterium]MBD3300967.1 hypothetical protein [Candidatus Eisenbacteria bacterium]
MRAASALQAPPRARAAGSVDARIESIRARIAPGSFDLLSLDVFDTVVWRMVPEPTDVAFLVADRLREAGALHPSSSRESFAGERWRSEKRAREQGSNPEVDLETIYAAFPAGFLR